jgi:hypothetical protein
MASVILCPYMIAAGKADQTNHQDYQLLSQFCGKLKNGAHSIE